MSRDPFETSAAPYVLGALSPADRAGRSSSTWTAARRCRARADELAGLPGLLARVGPEQVAGVEPTRRPPLPLPASLLPDLLAAVGQRRRRRRLADRGGRAGRRLAVLLAVLVGCSAPTPRRRSPSGR